MKQNGVKTRKTNESLAPLHSPAAIIPSTASLIQATRGWSCIIFEGGNMCEISWKMDRMLVSQGWQGYQHSEDTLFSRYVFKGTGFVRRRHLLEGCKVKFEPW